MVMLFPSANKNTQTPVIGIEWERESFSLIPFSRKEGREEWKWRGMGQGWMYIESRSDWTDFKREYWIACGTKRGLLYPSQCITLISQMEKDLKYLWIRYIFPSFTNDAEKDTFACPFIYYSQILQCFKILDTLLYPMVMSRKQSSRESKILL